MNLSDLSKSVSSAWNSSVCKVGRLLWPHVLEEVHRNKSCLRKSHLRTEILGKTINLSHSDLSLQIWANLSPGTSICTVTTRPMIFYFRTVLLYSEVEKNWVKRDFPERKWINFMSFYHASQDLLNLQALQTQQILIIIDRNRLLLCRLLSPQVL